MVQNLSFQISPGETLALVGESGSGKTLTALALLGLLPPHIHLVGGQVEFLQKRVTLSGEVAFAHLRGKHIAMIFQEPHAALNPVFRVGTQIRDVVQTHLGLRKKAAKNYTAELLSQVGFAEPHAIAKKYPHELSGGMAQRILIAIALSCNPQLIIADEPTTALDATSQLHILKLIENLQIAHRFALLLISHDIGLVEKLADTVVVLKNGKAVEYSSAEQLFHSPTHEYTRELINACCRRAASKVKVI
ncbi:MAG: ABC transporter ATP-binding protein [bacterium]